MAQVQKKTMALGAHNNLEKLRAKNPKLDITKFEGYNPRALGEFKASGKVFQEKKYDYITALSTGIGLSLTELLAIDPAPFPQSVPSSSVPTSSGAPTS